MIHIALRGLILAVMLFGAGPAAGQEEDFRLWETDTYAEGVLVLAPGLAEDGAFGEGKAGLFEISLGGSAERILESGARVGFRGAFRLQRDQAGRPGFAGNLAQGGPAGPRGGFTGLAAGPAADATGPRGSVESAHVYLEGGYGEVSAGRDRGVAARFHEGDVGVFSHAGAVSPFLDPSGYNLVQTRHDLTGPSAKLSYTSPRLLGLKAGLSYTPQADTRGLDRNPVFDGADVAAPGLENGFELALNGSRRLRDSGLRLRAGLGYSTAGLSAPQEEAGRASLIETFSAGGELEKGRWRVGVNALFSDEGLETGDYSAWSAGLAFEEGSWTYSASFGAASADAISAESTSFTLGAARDLGEIGTIALGYQGHDLDWRATASMPDVPFGARREGIVVEITLSP
ncbi:MAG: porin [Alphaproteobacteria bacterium]|jgi:hypothetical protein|nr:porin [Alphaproteobacteria bacterium]